MTVVNVTDGTLKGSVTGPTFTGNVDGAKFTGSVTYTDTAPVPPDNTAGAVTGFNPANGSRFQVGGKEVAAQNGNKSWSVTNPDKYTLRFEVRSGDVWASSGYNDSANNRSELEFTQRSNAGTKVTLSETLTLEPGPVSTASFFNFNQLHTTDPQSPPCPITFQLTPGDFMEIVVQWPGTDWHRVYRSPQPVARGKPMAVKFEAMMDADGSDGYLKVWLDGSQIVDYRGKIGANSPQQYYWKCGIYRKKAAETTAATYRNVAVT
jgi:polysaccharide lyase-like protein